MTEKIEIKAKIDDQGSSPNTIVCTQNPDVHPAERCSWRFPSVTADHCTAAKIPAKTDAVTPSHQDRDPTGAVVGVNDRLALELRLRGRPAPAPQPTLVAMSRAEIMPATPSSVHRRYTGA